jgi:subtilisin-like proprotein convertase family protein
MGMAIRGAALDGWLIDDQWAYDDDTDNSQDSRNPGVEQDTGVVVQPSADPTGGADGNGGTSTSVAASGNQQIDGLLTGVIWSGTAITYTDPDAAGDYQAGYFVGRNGNGVNAQNEGCGRISAGSSMSFEQRTAVLAVGAAALPSGDPPGLGSSKPSETSAGAESESAGPTSASIPSTVSLPTDPLLSSQWHLGNSGGLFDLNVRGVWNPASGNAYTGAGTWVVVIDNGFDYTHPDLAGPYDDTLDFDFESNTLDAFGFADQGHGTAVMGIIGADNNGTGAVGVAFDSNLVGYRTANLISDAWLQDIRDAIHHGALSALGDVESISQGISNDTNSEFGFGYNAARFDEIETSIGEAVSQGRGGLGTTIVKAAGNARGANFDVNADDWANDTRQVVVAAVDQNGFVSSYSSYGAAILVSAFGTPGQVVTTDRVGAAGYSPGDFTTTFNGTSAATPMVAGIVSLMYDANSGLGWRDVQNILAYSARHVGSAVGSGPAGSEQFTWGFNGAHDWNGGGLHFSNDYGYGLVDGLAAVRLAESWLLTGNAAQTNSTQFTNTMDMLNSTVTIPDGNPTGTSFTGTAGFNDEVDRVTVRITFSTTFTADLEVYLTSPSGTTSRLVADQGGDHDFNGTWTFESQAFHGERAGGTWTVRVVDDAGGDVLTVSDIVVTTFGRNVSDPNDRYVFTNEFSDYANVFGHSTTLTDTNGGNDTINAAAVTSGSFIDLHAGATSVIDGVALTIAAGTAIENAIGGDGDDTIVGTSNVNIMAGFRGRDTVSYAGSTAAVTVNLTTQIVSGGDAAGDTISGFENATGGSGDDTLLGDSGTNVLNGNGGNDTLNGRGGNDMIDGGGGSHNTAVYSGPLNVYYLTQLPNASMVIQDFRVGSPDGTDTDRNIQYFTFGNATYNFQELFRAPHDIAHDAGFSGDGRADLLFRGDNGQELIWNNANVGQATSLPSLSLSWHAAGIGDFNHDNSSDVVWHNDNGTNIIWKIQNNLYTAGFPLPSTTNDWEIAGVADYNHDGTSDLLWHSASGQNLIWQIQNDQYVNTFSLPTTPLGWSMAGTADLTGDGTPDILWHSEGGQNLIWQIQNDQYVNTFTLPTTPNGWQIVGGADFNHDGTNDILWHGANGETLIWQIQNGQYVNTFALPTPPPSWNILDVADFTGDGTPDILWHNNDSSQNLIWQIQNDQYVNTVVLPTTTPDWHIL